MKPNTNGDDKASRDDFSKYGFNWGIVITAFIISENGNSSLSPTTKTYFSFRKQYIVQIGKILVVETLIMIIYLAKKIWR